jgi:hypothetical protein
VRGCNAKIIAVNGQCGSWPVGLGVFVEKARGRVVVSPTSTPSGTCPGRQATEPSPVVRPRPRRAGNATGSTNRYPLCAAEPPRQTADSDDWPLLEALLRQLEYDAELLAQDGERRRV